MKWRHPLDLQPGDMLVATAPGAGEARVVRVERCRHTMTALNGREPRGLREEERAVMIVFEMLTGAKRGQSFASFNHPNDKVVIP